MHVHLPKPLHGWREFAGEVGIIVLGVLGELDDPGHLGAEDLAIVRQARSRAQVAADKLDAYLPQIVAAGAQLGVKPSLVIETPLTAKAVKALCRPAR